VYSAENEKLDLKKRTELIYTARAVENKIGSNRSRSTSEEKKTDLRKLNFLETVRRELSYVPVKTRTSLNLLIFIAPSN